MPVDGSMGDWPQWAKKEVPFGNGHSATVWQLIQDHDFEEPIPWNSPWLQRRLAVIKAVCGDSAGEEKESGDEAGEEKESEDFEKRFLFRMLLFYTGSDALLESWGFDAGGAAQDANKLAELQGRLEKVVAKKTAPLLEVLADSDLRTNVFHCRFRPMTIYHNAVQGKAVAAGAALSADLDDELELDDEGDFAWDELDNEPEQWKQVFLLQKCLPTRKALNMALARTHPDHMV